MPPPRPPSRVEPLSIPVFGISWFADPSNGRSITASCGGGGSARTGVKNLIIIQDGADAERTISTGDKVGLAIQIYKNSTTNKIWVVVALGSEVGRYSIPDGEANGVLSMHTAIGSKESEESCCAVSINSMTDRIAVGCDSGLIMIYATSDDVFSGSIPLFTCEGHTKSICAICFSLRGGKIVSSGKDGYARVWDSNNGDSISEMLCNCDDTSNTPKKGLPPSRSPSQILVRGCAFADMDGKVVLTVASARRGKAYLSQWLQENNGELYKCAIRSECSPNPISAMCMSQDGRLLSLGSVNGSIILWSVMDWTVLKIFQEVHDLPVTCIASRPFEVDLQGENFTGVRVHAKSASADGQMGHLTLQRKATKQNDTSRTNRSGGIVLPMHRFLRTLFVLLLLSPIAKETADKCGYIFLERRWHELGRCFIDDVLIAPPSRPGILSLPQ